MPPARPEHAWLAGAALLAAALAACRSPRADAGAPPEPTRPLAGGAGAEPDGALAQRGDSEARDARAGGADADLAPTFGEPFHGFVFLAPLALGPGDTVYEGSLGSDGRYLRLDGARGVYESRVVRREEGFDEVLPSWNVDVPSGASFRVDLRVGRSADDSWSPWLLIGDWGAPVVPRTTRFEGGKVAVDVFEGSETFDRAQLRISSTGALPIDVHRSSLAFTARERLPERVAAAAREPWPAPVAVRVPARSQRDEDPSIAGSVCSPTSVAMVMELNGVSVPTAALAAEILDPTHRIYGNWSRAVQAAFTHGVPGSLVRVSSWEAVARFLERKVPLVASVRAREGELRGAPYKKTDGHLLVVTGLGPAGQVLVNDPAAHWPGDVRRIYRREDLEKCWFANGGVAYAFDPAGPSRGTTPLASGRTP